MFLFFLITDVFSSIHSVVLTDFLFLQLPKRDKLRTADWESAFSFSLSPSTGFVHRRQHVPAELTNTIQPPVVARNYILDLKCWSKNISCCIFKKKTTESLKWIRLTLYSSQHYCVCNIRLEKLGTTWKNNHATALKVQVALSVSVTGLKNNWFTSDQQRGNHTTQLINNKNITTKSRKYRMFAILQ